MKHLRTSKCVVCGEKARGASGYVLAREKGALGNYYSVKVGAGKCKKHVEVNVQGISYDPDKMGECVPLFS